MAPGPSRTQKATPTFESINGELVELTKAGTVSRMRSHGGNKPAIPQSHLCHLCPAKFTRPTHLHRHLRTHLDSRSHKCDRCGREFTRSDLLTRHKRSCGDPAIANRTRRKSCQACADGKTKCDLQQPCARCKMRGCECTYDRRSAARKGKEAADASHPTSSVSPEGTPEIQRDEEAVARSQLEQPEFALSPFATADIQHSPFAASFSAPNLAGPSTMPSFVSTPHNLAGLGTSQSFQDFRVPSSYASSSGASTSHAPSVSGYSESIDTFPPTYSSLGGSAFAQEAYKVNNELNALFSTEFFDKFFNNFLDDKASAAGSDAQASTTASQDPPYGYGFDQFPFATEPAVEIQPFMGASMPPPLDPDFLEEICRMPLSWPKAPAQPVPAVAPTPLPQTMGLPMQPPLSHPPTPMPYPSEYQQYMHLFYQMFLQQMPVMHIGTFTIDGKPPFLLSAMQACGALYVKTAAASQFIDHTLKSVREQLVSEFAKKSTRSEDQVHLVLAVVLLQTIGLFHQRPDQRTHSNFYHGMLVTMIRQSGLIHRVTNWEPPVLTATTDIQEAWREWAFHETAKRALLLTYLHDTCHCIYFTLRPNFAADEVTVPLACEDHLWSANTPEEWLATLQKPSRYGELQQRLRPIGLQDALAFLADMRTDEELEPPLILDPVSHFVLSHAILRKLFDDCIARPAPGGDADAGPTEEGLAVQYMLHKWLKSWLHSPDTPRYSDVAEPRFLCDALPFYWIAQVALLAYQEKLPPFSSSHAASAAATDDGGAFGEAKFRLVKEWLRHIRQFLRKGEQGPTLFWDELTKIRMKSTGKSRARGGAFSDTESLGTVSDDSEGPGGLLGFFSAES